MFVEAINLKVCKALFQELLQFTAVDLVSLRPTKEFENAIDMANISAYTERIREWPERHG